MRSRPETGHVEGWEPAVTNDLWGHRERPKLVWVRLDAIMVRNPGLPIRNNTAGIDMSGEVPGLLHGWIPTAKGDWMGLVNFDVHYADGRPLRLRQQLVPSYALRERVEPESK
ncbi:hypothetical protein SAMN05421776_1089 [Nocardia farcinica]|uniref:Uncharacterized protein n=2 Tax=Nocardia farcinica TaxID=37329 RepID=A0A0H5PQ20_NOCFR|nr:hypothetical protein [Nocardia farcinica]CRY84427.1 Uncharacterised protein [Nocardia farcinica]CRY84511.1 Uncharacterised protein [Nocardia farcinica]SIT28970.1 hypothetical protein SAMN05421776_1089 [Nocardia farcinica]